MAVTNCTWGGAAANLSTTLLGVLLLTLTSGGAYGAILPPDRADVLYHSYHGGGMSIDGPALLIRKKASESVAVSAYYYLDSISSASVDVISTASPYTEERHEGQLGLEYLRDKTLIALSLRQSDEDDYLSRSIGLSVSQDTFGDLTTLSLGLGYGDNDIGRNGDDNFSARSEQYRVSAGLSQIVSRNLTTQLNIEAIADQGFLNNPYRTVRYLDSTIPAGVGYQAEVYPETRNSFAAKVSASYFLPYRAALLGHYRYYRDSWEISANDIELGYRQPLLQQLELELKLRYYQQSQAEFYSDLFAFRDAQNYLARDKELSEFNNYTLGLGLTYQLPATLTIADLPSEISLQWDHIRFDYDNFRDPTASGGVGNEPFYQFSANVVRAFYSLYF
ncbi:DUF3570 domain-containing protein [uncultured Ferrimonas sp.]|uniref:DUF3570 domain-containing protein n=1 Tax=uncultured Ferrimonas sp. TaxID=432640 RepID=UPI002624D94B|nr:DUF3570 domain-containing protein [uncultured Ferrimonas sp.]